MTKLTNNQKMKKYANIAYSNLEDKSGNDLEHYARIINHLVEEIHLDENYENLDLTLKILEDLQFMLKNMKSGLRNALREKESL